MAVKDLSYKVILFDELLSLANCDELFKFEPHKDMETQAKQNSELISRSLGIQ
jgi:hypothetical protein